MNYLLKNKRRESGARKSLIGALAILALAGFFYFFSGKEVDQAVYYLARPIWNARNYVTEKFTGFWSALSDKQKLLAENASLQEELDGARRSLVTLDAYKKENEDLKKLLGRNPAEKRLLAAVLAKPNQSSYDTLVLDAGKNRGVQAGDAVLAGDFVIGDIREVYDNYSKAVLTSSPGETFTVRIGDSKIDTEADGRGGGNFIAKLPKEITVRPGDLVKSAGLEPRFFGAVEDIERTETGSFQFILFKLPVNINSLDWVEIAI